mmetsp:Transcript_5451/g.14649  ORF Transcript_5451/g.14649 Transcript_5451/m.14649 type:complete len:108 (-) Transcript_5451:122-445(-)
MGFFGMTSRVSLRSCAKSGSSSAPIMGTLTSAGAKHANIPPLFFFLSVDEVCFLHFDRVFTRHAFDLGRGRGQQTVQLVLRILQRVAKRVTHGRTLLALHAASRPAR